MDPSRRPDLPRERDSYLIAHHKAIATQEEAYPPTSLLGSCARAGVSYYEDSGVSRSAWLLFPQWYRIMKNDYKIDTLGCCAPYELGITRHGRNAQRITSAKDNFISGSHTSCFS